MATKIYIAAGHGGTDPGATGNGINERDFTENAVNKAVAIAKTQLAPNHSIVLVPHSYQYIETVNYFNRTAGPNDILVDVHLNSNGGTPGTGTETWYGLKAFAATFQGAMVRVLGLSNRGIKYSDQFYVTRGAVAGGAKSGIIAEMGFINNSHDVAVLKKKAVTALATALKSTSYAKYMALNPEVAPAPVKPEYELNDAPMLDPREMVANKDTYVIDLKTGKPVNTGTALIKKGAKVSFIRQTKVNNVMYYRSRYAVTNNLWQGLKQVDFDELVVKEPVINPPVPPTSDIPELEDLKVRVSSLEKMIEAMRNIFK